MRPRSPAEYLSESQDTQRRVARARAAGRRPHAFCEVGVLNIAGVNGYYTNLAVIMNTTRFPIPRTAKDCLASRTSRIRRVADAPYLGATSP
jgi:hypothetical protein